MLEKIKNNEKVTILHNTAVQEIYGDRFVCGAKVQHGNEVNYLKVQGVFIEIGSVAASDYARDIDKNKDGEILVDCGCRTNVEGIFAAGDVTSVPAKQIVVASGEGAKALISAFNYISRNR